jgi:hypothetical protein
MKIVAMLITLFSMTALYSCGKSGGSAPNPSGTDNSTTSGSGITCGTGGSLVGGTCWYYAADNTSCTATCATRGGYNAATLSYAGSGGNAANCAAVMDAIGAPASAVISQVCGLALGCMFDSFTPSRFFCSGPATNAGDAYVGGRRACSCNQ